MEQKSLAEAMAGYRAQAHRWYLALFVGRRKAATGLAAVLALAVAFHVVFGANGVLAFEQKKQQKKMLNDEMVELQQENDRLKGHVDRLQSDPEAIEQQAREQLHYTRAGEVIYALPGK